MSFEIKTLSKNLQEKITTKNLLSSQLEDLENNKEKLKRRVKNVETARTFLQVAAKKTQEKLQFQVSEIVSLALEAVFDDPYEFNLEYVTKRNKTEAEISFMRDGVKIDPMESSGGGVVDIASFALRIALWKMSSPKLRNTIVLDEPFKHLSSNLQPKASEMLKLLSEKLELQFIMVTHNDHLIGSADKVFQVKMKNKISEVSVL